VYYRDRDGCFESVFEILFVSLFLLLMGILLYRYLTGL